MTVYVVQKQMRYNSDTRSMEPRFPSIVKAEKWGELKYCLAPNEHPYEPDIVVAHLHEALRSFNADDYLILVGNPILLGLATSVAAHYSGGSICFLQWSSKIDDYAPVQTVIY